MSEKEKVQLKTDLTLSLADVEAEMKKLEGQAASLDQQTEAYDKAFRELQSAIATLEGQKRHVRGAYDMLRSLKERLMGPSHTWPSILDSTKSPMPEVK